MSSNDNIPNSIMGSLGSVPATIQSAKCAGVSGMRTARHAVRRLRKYMVATRKMTADNDPTIRTFSSLTAITSCSAAVRPINIAAALR